MLKWLFVVLLVLVVSGCVEERNLIIDNTNAVKGSGTIGVVPLWVGSSELGDSPIYINSNNGTEILGDLLIQGDIINVESQNISGNIIPTLNNTFTLGNDTKKFSSLDVVSLNPLSGYVGIGNVPSTILDVKDSNPVITLRDSNNVNNNNASIVYRTATSGIYAGMMFHRDVSPLSHISFWTRNAGSVYAERMRIDATGNIGLGTENPISRLHINSTGTINSNNPDIAISGTLSSINASRGIAFIHPNGNSMAYIGMTTDSVGNQGELKFATATSTAFNSTERMRIDNSGNVGIGTSIPLNPLDVNGIIRSRGSFYFANSSGTIFYSQGISGALGLQFKDEGVGNGIWYMLNSSNSAVSGLSMRNGQSWIGNIRGASLGIGTSNPQMEFHVLNGINNSNVVGVYPQANNGSLIMYEDAQGDIWIRMYDNANNEHTRIRPDGISYFNNSLGIGTSNPEGLLELEANDGTDMLRLQQTNAGAGANVLQFSNTRLNMSRVTGSNAGLSFYTSNQGSWGSGTNAGDFIFYPNRTEAFRIDVSGNVSIGTNETNHKLVVVGNVNVTGNLNVTGCIQYNGGTLGTCI